MLNVCESHDQQVQFQRLLAYLNLWEQGSQGVRVRLQGLRVSGTQLGCLPADLSLVSGDKSAQFAVACHLVPLPGEVPGVFAARGSSFSGHVVLWQFKLLFVRNLRIGGKSEGRSFCIWVQHVRLRNWAGVQVSVLQ